MRQAIRATRTLLVVAALASPLALTRCAMHHGPNSPWMSVEEPHYEKWERATHRTHMQYDVRAEDEQKEYWEWRTTHS